MARFSPDPQARGRVEELRAEVSFRKLVRSFGRVVLWWTVRESDVSGAACRDFLRKVVLSSTCSQAQPLGLSDLERRKNHVRTSAADPPFPYPASGLC